MSGALQTGRIVLASGSLARASVLRNAGVAFDVNVAGVDEGAVKAAGLERGAEAAEVALVLAELKARAVDGEGALVVGADQMLVCEGVWFDKPVSLDAARRQLQALRGTWHELVTAVLCLRDGVERWRHVARPRLLMRSFSDAFLEAYLSLEGDRILQSVGGYRLEGPGAHLFERVEGEHSAVLGLPLLPLLQFLREDGVVLV